MQLLPLQPQRLPALVPASRQAATHDARRADGDLPVQQARHPPPLLPQLRMCALRVWPGTDRRADGRRECALSRERRPGDAQAAALRRAFQVARNRAVAGLLRLACAWLVSWLIWRII